MSSKQILRDMDFGIDMEIDIDDSSEDDFDHILASSRNKEHVLSAITTNTNLNKSLHELTQFYNKNAEKHLKPVHSQDEIQISVEVETKPYSTNNSNPVQTLNRCLVYLMGVVDKVMPQDNPVAGVFLLNLFLVGKWFKKKAQYFYNGYRTRFFAVNVYVTVILMAAFPGTSIFILSMVSAASFTGTLSVLALLIFGSITSAGLLPMFIVTLILLIIFVIVMVFSFFIVSNVLEFISSYLPIRFILVFFADLVPPSVGRAEVSSQIRKRQYQEMLQKQKLKKTQQVEEEANAEAEFEGEGKSEVESAKQEAVEVKNAEV